MIRKILNQNADDGYFVNDIPFNIQAFADDVILISSNVDSLKAMINTVKEFCSATGMSLAPQKCQWLNYSLRNRRRCVTNETIDINNVEIKAIDISGFITYLDAPISILKSTKMKQIEDMALYSTKRLKIGLSHDTESNDLFYLFDNNQNHSISSNNAESNVNTNTELNYQIINNIRDDIDSDININIDNASTLPTYNQHPDDQNFKEHNITYKEILKTISFILRKRHYNNLSSLPFKGHSFIDTHNSPCSNFFIGNHRTPFQDYLTKFAIKARTNSLPTKEVLNKRLHNNNNNNNDSKCLHCGQNLNDSLMHRLNKCTANNNGITLRQDNIAHVIANCIKDTLGPLDAPPIHENCNVSIANYPDLPDRSKHLKPDIWYSKLINNVLHVWIVEVTCPYAMLTDTATGRISTLHVRRLKKVQKYTPLVEDIELSWNAKVSLAIIVVSSLGVIPKDTFNEIKNITRTKKRALITAKRCAHVAIAGSWRIFTGHNVPFLNELTYSKCRNTNESESQLTLNLDTVLDDLETNSISRNIGSPIVSFSNDPTDHISESYDIEINSQD
ncbi:hypothetical protein TRFO_33290 [Tritrichomonas foetus]|uniref:Reverse transcriptase domain-containing protein n=1 Tax=Tritrichomonas foetus TaxID=1144522 RepID=A0A1J4JLU9_9EUKA|nr:hypothetical protein TRFO_33290 [Tritrichomonas foetus]|eukprot:OHT00059.1 hypothetical protein TRFO_33290 [Tritrichomonas foetus]